MGQSSHNPSRDLQADELHKPSKFAGGMVRNKELNSEYVPMPPDIQKIYDNTVVPKELDWRNYQGKGVNYLTWTVNEHVPQYCNSNWVQGITSSIGDRFNIYEQLRLNRLPTSPIYLSPQQVMDCASVNDLSAQGCNFGDPNAAMKYIYEHGATHGSCEQYIAYNE